MSKSNLVLLEEINNENYGVCGDKAFLDSNGDQLYVGDLIRLIHDDGDDHGNNIVCNNKSYGYFVRGIAGEGRSFEPSWHVYKEKSYMSMKDGDWFDGIKYITEEAYKDIINPKIKTSDIKITKCFKSTIPDELKIAMRIKEYKRKNKFSNKIILNQDGFLIDGYTQYLVCKMLDINEVEIEYKERDIS